MKRFVLDDVRNALPRLDELRPILDDLIARSEPDPDRVWSGSGELDTIGSRLLPRGAPGRRVAALAASEAARLRNVYDSVGRALDALAADDGDTAARAFLEAAALEEAGDRPDRAAAYAEAAHRAARDASDRRTAALALRRWARAARAQGHLGDASERYARAYEIASAISDARGAAEAAIGAGNVLEEQGRWLASAAWYQKALDSVEALGDAAPEQWHALLNLHIVTRSRGAIEESRPLLERAEEAAGRVDPRGAAPFVENARAQLAMAAGAFAEAERHFRRALDGASGARALVSFRLNLAEALLAQGRVLDAAEQAREAERQAIRASLVPKLPETYRLLGRISSAADNNDAFVFFERALEIIRERALPVLEEATTLQAYAECEARRGETEAAEQLHEDARERFESLGLAHMRQAWADVYAPKETSDEDGAVS